MALTKISTAMISQSAAAVDLNVDAGTFYVDTTNNRVGVGGKTDPDTPLHVIGTATATTFAGSGASLTSIPNSALVNSSITINSTATSLGGSITLGTDDVAEGSSNLYYTNARADARIAAADTDDLSEGSSNLYYTDARVDARVSGGSLGNITTTGYIRGPATFTIDPAAHGDNTGTVVIAGNLQVDGTQTVINSTTLTVDDKNITLASGSANAAAASGAGFTVDIGTGTNPAITYDGTNDEWAFNKKLNVIGDLDVDSGSAGKIDFGKLSTTAAYGRLYADSTGTFIGSKSNHDLILRTNNLEKVRIKTDGKVGIGTDTPNTNVQVYHATDDTSINVNHGTGGSYPKKSGISFGAISTSLGGDATFTGGAGIQAINTAAANNLTEMAFFTTSGGSPTERMRIDELGNIGFAGQTSPNYKLDGGFATQTWGWYLNSSYNAGFTYNTAERSIEIFTKSADNADHIKFSTGGSGPTERMRIDSSGKVGIGTSLPTANLEISSASNPEISIASTAGATSNFLNFKAISHTQQIQTQLKTIDNNDFTADLAFLFKATGTGGALTEKMRITSAGKVGIGTSGAPDAFLHVKTGTAQNDAHGLFKIEQTSTAATTAATNSGLTIKNHHGTSQFMQWEEQGIRIGSRILTNSGIGDVIFTAGADSEKMRIEANGNVGIGVQVPSYKLEVNGTLGSGAITSNGNLTIKGASGFNAAGETASIYLGDTASEIRATYGGGTKFFVNGTDRMEIEGSSGNLNLKTGNFEINGTTVIDSSRNLTNIGTISSGTITSSGDLETATRLKFTSNIANGWSAPIIFRESAHLALSDYSGVKLGGFDGTSYGPRFHVNGNGNVDILEGDLLLGTTTVIDSSRVVQNVTLGHSNTGARFETNDWMFDTGGKARFYFEQTGRTFFGSDNGFIYRDNTDTGRATISNDGGLNLRSGGDGQVGSTVALAVSGTTVIDSSRNLTNIGTISSGAITGTDATFTSAVSASTLAVTNMSDATGLSFRTAYEAISGEGWATAHYQYNVNDGTLFLNRDASSIARPVFHIAGHNNVSYHPNYSYSVGDAGMVTLAKPTGTKQQGTTYAHTGLSNAGEYSNWIKDASATRFFDSDGLHEFHNNVDINGSLKINKDYTSNQYLWIFQNVGADGGIVMSDNSGGARNNWQIVPNTSSRDLQFYSYAMPGHHTLFNAAGGIYSLTDGGAGSAFFLAGNSAGAANGKVAMGLRDGMLQFRDPGDYYHKMWYYDGVNVSTNQGHGHFRVWGDSANSAMNSTSGEDTLRFSIDTVTGNIGTSDGATNIYNASDERLKENVTTLPSMLNKINALRPISYDWKYKDGETGIYGFIAQEVQEVDASLVFNSGDSGYRNDKTYGEDLELDGTIEDTLAINERKLFPMLVKAIQEQQTIIDDLKARIAVLEG
jgi:hypothetical protein